MLGRTVDRSVRAVEMSENQPTGLTVLLNSPYAHTVMTGGDDGQESTLEILPSAKDHHHDDRRYLRLPS